MASSPEFMEYIAGQLGGEAEGITYRKMFGEYGIYRHGKFFAVVCDGALFFKPTAAGRSLLEARGSLVEAPPYEGASLYYLIENNDDAEFLRQLCDVTCQELPMPKPKKPKASNDTGKKE